MPTGMEDNSMASFQLFSSVFSLAQFIGSNNLELTTYSSWLSYVCLQKELGVFGLTGWSNLRSNLDKEILFPMVAFFL